MDKNMDAELVDRVRDEIFTMALAGRRIREQDLTAKFKVSRTSIRDVLKQLQVEKLIDRRKKQRYHPASIFIKRDS